MKQLNHYRLGGIVCGVILFLLSCYAYQFSYLSPKHPSALYRTFKEPEDSFTQFGVVAINRDGSLVAAGSSFDSSAHWVKVWSLQTGKLLRQWSGGAATIGAITFAPDGRTLAIADDKVRLWDTRSGKTLKSRHGEAYNLQFSPDGKLLACAAEKTIALWDVATGSVKKVLKGNNTSIMELAFSPNGKWMVSVGQDQIVRLWDVQTGYLKSTQRQHKENIYACAFVGGNKSVASIDQDGVVLLWDLATNKVKRISANNPTPINAATFSPDGTLYAKGSWTTGLTEDAGRILEVGSALTGAKVFSVTASGSVDSLALSNNGYLTVGDRIGSAVQVWKIR